MSGSQPPPRVTIHDVAAPGRGLPADGEQRADPSRPRCSPDTLAGCGRRSTSWATGPRRRPSRCAPSAPGRSGSRSTPSGPRSHNETMAPFLAAPRHARRVARPAHRAVRLAREHADARRLPADAGPRPGRRVRPRRHPPRRPAPALAGGERHPVRRPSAGSGTTRPTPAGSTSTAPPAPGPPSAHCVAAGYATVAFLGWPQGSVVGDDRRRAGSRAAPPPAPTTPAPRRPPCRTSTPPATPPRLLLREVGPGDAVVCASDILALGVHHELLTAGLRPGLDVGVVGFDGSETALMHHLTSVAQPLDAIAEQVLVLLDDAMAGRPRPAAGVLLEPALTLGRSTDRQHRPQHPTAAPDPLTPTLAPDPSHHPAP